MSSSPQPRHIPTLLRPPSFHPAAVEWTADGKPRYVVINPMHIITLQDRTRTFAVRLVEKIKAVSERWFTHVLLLMFLLIYASLGALIFQMIEAPVEKKEKNSIIHIRTLIVDNLWRLAQVTNESDWTKLAYKRMKDYEGQIEEHVRSKTADDSEKTVWTFWGSLFYAGTIFTTIGYGNMVPATTAGKAVTIVYAFIGIPFLLMVLADLGKLFTRAIKAVFYYIKLFCHTGKFQKARRMGRRATAVPVQYMTVAWNKMPYMVYQGRQSKKRGSADDFDRDLESGTKRDSTPISDDNYSEDNLSDEKSVAESTKDPIISKDDGKENRAKEDKKEKSKKDDKKKEKSKKKNEDKDKTEGGSDNDEDEIKDRIIHETIDDVDDEFNLPVSLAIVLLIGYMMFGAALFTLWEDDWTFFESFYFVFISMSTIGFGDYVPEHQMYMIATFIYLLFGLALTSMCINVIQEKLSATFEMAKMRIGTTIGLDANILMEEDITSDKSETPDSQSKSNSVKSRRGSKAVVPKSQSKERELDEKDTNENLQTDTTLNETIPGGNLLEPPRQYE